MFKGIYRWVRGRIKYHQMKRWMDQRATSTAVKLVTTGALRLRA
jgi:hypothetical protein